MRGLNARIEQLLQIASDYSSLPDLRTMELYEIRFFYEPLISGLAAQQREDMKSGK